MFAGSRAQHKRFKYLTNILTQLLRHMRGRKIGLVHGVRYELIIYVRTVQQTSGVGFVYFIVASHATD